MSLQESCVPGALGHHIQTSHQQTVDMRTARMYSLCSYAYPVASLYFTYNILVQHKITEIFQDIGSRALNQT